MQSVKKPFIYRQKLELFSHKTIFWLHTMVIRSMIIYAAVVWWPRVNYTTVEKQFACT